MTSQLASIVMTDLVDSTAVRVRLGEERADLLRRTHDAMLRDAVEANDGRVVKGLGDGVLAVFSGAADAVAAAVAIQQAAESHTRRHPQEPLSVRIGVSAGDVATEAGDVFGTPVIEAARLCAAAEGGEVLIADLVRALARGRGGYQFGDTRALELKGLDGPVAACTVAWEPLEASGPGSATALVRFRLLGPVEVDLGDGSLDLGGPRRRALLTRLLLTPNQPVPAERLAADLWPGEAADRSVSALRTLVARTRQTLGSTARDKGPLQSRPSGYVLVVGTETIDATCFEALVRSGREALAGGRAEEASATLAEALALWRGPACGEFRDQPWAVATATRLEELRLGALEDRIDADLACGRHVALVGELDALVAMHPLRERLQGQLMLALYRSGRQSEALRAYEELRAQLGEQLGIGPGPELVALEQAMRSHLPDVDWRPHPPRAGSSPAGVDDDVAPIPLPVGLDLGEGRLFVGRGEHLAVLEEAWRRCQHGGRQVVLVSGEPGVGKTALAGALARMVHAEGAIVLHGRCDDELDVPYQPFVEALGHVVRSSADVALAARLGPRASELVRLDPDIAQRLPDLPPPRDLDPETDRYRMFEAVSAWLGRLSTGAPVLLVLDDLQWAAKATLLLFRAVALAERTDRVLIVGTCRDSDGLHDVMTDELGALWRSPSFSRVRLGGFDQNEVEAYLMAALDVEDDRRRRSLAHQLVADTGGNPLFVSELVRQVHNDADLQIGASVPERVQTVVRQRVARLPPPTPGVLELAAASGHEFEYAVLLKAGGHDEDTLADALDHAVTAGLLQELPGHSLRYRFTHSLIRGAVYERLTGTRRAILHQHLGDAIEQLHVHDVEEHLASLALHFSRAPASNAARALDYTRRSAERALRLLEHDQAVEAFQQALELLDSLPENPQLRCDVLLRLGEAQLRAGEACYRETLLESARIAQGSGDGHRLAAAALANSRAVFSATGQIDGERVAVLESALELSDERDSPVRARLHANLAGELAFSGEWARRCDLSDAAVAMARRLDDPATLAHVLNQRHDTIWHASTLAERVAISEELAALAERLDDPRWVYMAALIGIGAAFEIGDLELADRRLAVASHLAQELGQPILRWFVALPAATRAVIAGRLEDAERLGDEAFELGVTTGQPDTLIGYAAHLFVVRFLQGRVAELAPLVEDVHQQLPVPAVAAARGLVACVTDRPDDAATTLESLAAEGFDRLPYDLTWAGTLVLAAELCAHLRHRARAAELTGLLEPFRDQFVMTGPVWWGSMARTLGRLAQARGDLDAAVRELEHAVTVHERLGATAWAHRSRLDLAEALEERRGDSDAARADQLRKHARAATTAL